MRPAGVSVPVAAWPRTDCKVGQLRKCTFSVLTTLLESAATLIGDGEVIAAAEEERFSRRNHHCGLPYGAVRYCLEQAGISIVAVAHVGLYWKPWILLRRHR